MRRNSMLAQVGHNCCVNGQDRHLIKLYNGVGGKEERERETMKNKRFLWNGQDNENIGK